MKPKETELSLDEEELQILGDFERGEFESIRNFRHEKKKLEEAATGTLQKDKRINIKNLIKGSGGHSEACCRGRHPLPDLDLKYPAQVRHRQFEGISQAVVRWTNDSLALWRYESPHGRSC
jgi:hypothetical protein